MPRGRPRKPVDEKLGDPIQVRLLPTDRQSVKAAAAAAGVDEAVWVRETVVAAARIALGSGVDEQPRS